MIHHKPPAIGFTENIPTDEECRAAEERLARLQRQHEDLKRLRDLMLDKPLTAQEREKLEASLKESVRCALGEQALYCQDRECQKRTRTFQLGGAHYLRSFLRCECGKSSGVGFQPTPREFYWIDNRHQMPDAE